ncbi:MAG: dUTP diphosphatase [Clostridia bacterium]|nr:dUTP diphosphatase [Clostridia bacterium]
MPLPVHVKLTRGMTLPEYATEGSAAVDLRAAIDEGTTLVLLPGERALVPTGIAISPKAPNVVAVVAARSGLASKFGISLANGIGVIDSDYRGEISVALVNLGKEAFEIHRGDRIAQLLFMPVLAASFTAVDELDSTARGEGGFGHTGVK